MKGPIFNGMLLLCGLAMVTVLGFVLQAEHNHPKKRITSWGRIFSAIRFSFTRLLEYLLQIGERVRSWSMESSEVETKARGVPAIPRCPPVPRDDRQSNPPAAPLEGKKEDSAKRSAPIKEFGRSNAGTHSMDELLTELQKRVPRFSPSSASTSESSGNEWGDEGAQAGRSANAGPGAAKIPEGDLIRVHFGQLNEGK